MFELQSFRTPVDHEGPPGVPGTRIGPSALVASTRTEVLRFASGSSHRACGVGWAGSAEDLFCLSQEDPARLAGRDLNFYPYSRNSPTIYTDPTGLVVCAYSISSHTLWCSPNDKPNVLLQIGPQADQGKS